VVHTTQASVEEAVREASLTVSAVLKPSDMAAGSARSGVSLTRAREVDEPLSAPPDGFFLELNDVVLYDRDNNPGTTGDQVRVDGSLALQPSFDLSLSVEQYRLTRLTFVARASETTTLTLHSDIDLLNLQRTIEVARYPLNPLTVWVAWVPVVITPVLTVNIGLDGKVSIGLEAGATQTATLLAGLDYENGAWSPLSDLSHDFTFDPPHITSGLNVKPFGEVQLSLLVYGVVGPYETKRGFLEVDADAFRCPWWSLYGGIEATVGVKLAALGVSVADFEAPNLIALRLSLAEAEGASGTDFTGAWAGRTSRGSALDSQFPLRFTVGTSVSGCLVVTAFQFAMDLPPTPGCASAGATSDGNLHVPIAGDGFAAVIPVLLDGNPVFFWGMSGTFLSPSSASGTVTMYRGIVPHPNYPGLFCPPSDITDTWTATRQ
jgi:hypothetical protein